MAAIAQQMLARLSERAVKVEFRDRTARAFPLLSRKSDEDGGPSKLFDQTRSNYSDHARMPALIGEHDREHLVEIHCEHSFARLLERRVVDLLTAVIQLLDRACNHVRLV